VKLGGLREEVLLRTRAALKQLRGKRSLRSEWRENPGGRKALQVKTGGAKKHPLKRINRGREKKDCRQPKRRGRPINESGNGEDANGWGKTIDWVKKGWGEVTWWGETAELKIKTKVLTAFQRDHLRSGNGASTIAGERLTMGKMPDWRQVDSEVQKCQKRAGARPSRGGGGGVVGQTKAKGREKDYVSY